ncbi:hypothetical protein DL765_003439 [Monosporascus sp. GIB2]|nr:hypothetical protein DL765_003439 [Monosporascus sp. GIB2]
MASPQILHILDKADYSNHRLVTLPSHPLPALAPSSLRLQSKILGLTTNNLGYARLGHLTGWWDVYPQPKNTPAPYDNRSIYGRISAWGYAEIIESTVPDIPVGTTVYGYLPTSNLPEDVRVEHTGLKDQIFVSSEHRQHLWEVYNRYQICAPLAELEKAKTLDSLGWDSLMQGLFGAGYNLNLCGFAWKDELRIHPSGKGEWTAEDASLKDATVIVLSASSKTALAFAHQVRHNRPADHQPRTVVGVCSSASRATAVGSGFYDQVILYSDDKITKDAISKDKPNRTILIDFGAREGARETWNATLSTLSSPHSHTFMSVGGEVKVQSIEDIRAQFAANHNTIQVNTSYLREKGIEVGGDAYLEAFYKKFDEFKAQGGIPGVTLKWGEGMKALEKGWEALCRDEVSAGTGLVYRL